MKRFLFMCALILLMAGSLLAGTLAYYTTTVDLAEGSVIAKEFIFLGDGTDSFAKDEKIAPSETVAWPFRVKNFDGGVITETDLYYRLTVTVSASEGREAIAPLVVALKDSAGAIVGTVTGTGTFEIYGEFPLAESGQYHDYGVEIYWPGGGEDDINYAGSGFGNTIKVSALASQVPLTSVDPTDPDEPPDSGIHVLYETTTVQWQTEQFRYKITITNNSDWTIENWQITFTLSSDRITSVELTARADHEGLDEGSYKFHHPPYGPVNIAPGESISFGGKGIGWGWDNIENVLVNGNMVELDCSLEANR